METAKYITMNGASYLEAHVHSFETEKAFIDSHLKDLETFPEVDRKPLLKKIYKAAHKK